MSDTNLDFIVSDYVDSDDDFVRVAKSFFSSNDQYRGYEQLVELVDKLDFNSHDLYQIYHHEDLAGLAAIEYRDKVLYFNIFVVNPYYREIGIGDELFDHIIQLDKYSEATAYESYALPGDRHTKNFFETRKGKARLLIVGGPIVRGAK